MANTVKRLTVAQWAAAVDALCHAESDYESWTSDGDPSAKELLKGIRVLRMLIDDRRPRDDWDRLSEQKATKE